LDGAGTGSAAGANGCGGVSTGNAASGVGSVCIMSVAAGVGAGDASSVALGTGKASWVPKTSFLIAVPGGLHFWVLTSTLPRFPQQSAVLFTRI